jgi:hypothetical protein
MCVLAEELLILDPDSASWQAVRPLLTIALNIEQHDNYVWYGWNKRQITSFLEHLPAHSTLIVAVWSTDVDEQEQLQLGFVCEVREGQICTIRTFESLVGEDVPPVQALEPGAEHALAIMRRVRVQVAPVAWALFTDKATWDEWLYTDEKSENHKMIDKEALLTAFAQQGRCVLMGSQAHHHER